jgi:hypothetical protein
MDFLKCNPYTELSPMVRMLHSYRILIQKYWKLYRTTERERKRKRKRGSFTCVEEREGRDVEAVWGRGGRRNQQAIGSRCININ